MSDLENKLYNDSMSENTKVLSNHKNSLRGVLQYKDSDNTFIRPTEKKTENNLKNSFVTTEKHLQKENTESKEESLDLNELLKTEFDLPQDLKVFDPKKLQFDNLFEKALTCYRNNQIFKAIPIFKKLLEINPNNLKVMRFLSECLLSQNKAREGLGIAQKGLEASQKQINKYYIIIFHALIAHGFEALKEYKNAIKHYKLALFHDRTIFKNNVDLVKCYIKFNKIDEAYTACENSKFCILAEGDEEILNDLKRDIEKKYFELHPEKKYISEGYDYYMKGEHQLALKKYEKALEISPKDLSILGKLFSVYISLDRVAEAINVGEKVISTDTETLEKYYEKRDINPELYKIYSGLAEIYEHTWHFIKARQYKTMSEYHQLIQRGRFQSIFSDNKAIEFFRAAYNLKPQKHEALIELITCLYLDEKFEEALKYIKIGVSMAKSEKNTSNLAKYYNLEASCYGDMKQSDKEQESFEKKLKLTNNVQEKLNVYWQLALSNKSRKNNEKAKEYLEKCHDLVYQGTEDSIDIQTAIMEIDAISDNNSDYNLSYKYLRKASSLCSKKEYNEALANLEKAFWLMPHDLKVMEAYSRCLCQQEYYKEASNIAYEALEIAKDRGDKKYVESFFYTLAQYHYYQQKNYDEARKFLELASGHNPNCFEYVYMAALCYKNTSRTERAINCFEKAFELKPTEKHILDEVYQLAQIFSKESQEEFIEWLTRQKYHFPQSS